MYAIRSYYDEIIIATLISVPIKVHMRIPRIDLHRTFDDLMMGTIHQCNIRDEENGTEGTQKQGGDTSSLGFYNISKCE